MLFFGLSLKFFGRDGIGMAQALISGVGKVNDNRVTSRHEHFGLHPSLRMHTRHVFRSLPLHCLAPLTFIASAAGAQTLTAAEQKMVTYTQQHAPEQVAFLEK